MDYEYYDAPISELTEDEAFEQRNIISAMYLYEEIEAESLIMPSAPITAEFNLFYGVDPSDRVFRWQLHHPESE